MVELVDGRETLQNVVYENESPRAGILLGSALLEGFQLWCAVVKVNCNGVPLLKFRSLDSDLKILLNDFDLPGGSTCLLLLLFEFVDAVPLVWLV